MRKAILLDVDPGIDDALALLYALRHPCAEVLGITCVAGNVPVETGALNACRVVELAGAGVPVHIGAGKPLVRDLVTAQDTHGEDGLGECALPAPSRCLPAPDAHGFLVETLRQARGKVILLALGPLTNIARLAEAEPDLLREKAELWIMGGAAKSHGNCSPLAEFNFWVDPHAAQLVFEKLEDIRLVPLDVTREIVFRPDYRELARQLGGPFGKFIHAITRYYVDFHWAQERTLGCVINDPLAVALALDPSLGTAEPYAVEIIPEGPSMGQSVVDFAGFHGRPANASIFLETEPERFFASFFSVLFPEQVEDIRKVLNPRPPFQVRRP